MTRRVHLLIPVLGVIVASSAAIMIRFAQAGGYSSTSLAAGRLGFAALLLWIYRPGRSIQETRRIETRDKWLCVVAGVFLALHFEFWISSLEFTSVAGSVALVTTSPLWVGLLGPIFLREKPHRSTMIAAVIAIAGAVLIGLGDALVDLHSVAVEAIDAPPSTSVADSAPGPIEAVQLLFGASLRGNILAVLGAISVSGYLLVGRSVRARVGLGAYIRLVYSSAAIVLCGYALVRGIPLIPPRPELLLWAVLLALGPQLLGHTAFNWALKHFSAVVVTIIILGEPVGSAILAALVLGEFPGLAPLSIGSAVFHLPLQLIGIAVLLSGVVLAGRSE